MPVRFLFPSFMALCLFAFGCAQPSPEIVEVPVTVEVLREVPVTVEIEREVTQAPVTVERIVTVEVEKVVQVPVEVEVTREVTVEVIQEVTREVTVEVTREVTVVKNTPPPTRTERLEAPTYTPTPTDSQECQQYLADVQQYVVFIQNRYDAVGEILDKLANGEISDNAAEVRNRSLYTEIRNESADWNLSHYMPPEILRAVFILVNNFSYANVKLMDAVFDGERDDVIRDRARAMTELLLEMKVALADPPACG